MIFQQKFQEIIENFFIFSFCKFNNILNKSVFPDELKHADIKPNYKIGSKNEKLKTCDFLRTLSKIFERCKYYQLKDCFD